MRTLRNAAVGLSLLLGLGSLAYADPPDQAAKPATGWSPWWPPNWFAAKAAPKADDRPPTARVDERAKVAPVVESARLSREREEKAYLRRQAVCDKLESIAERTGDESLRRKAQVLAERAFALYLQRTSGGPGSGDDLGGEARLLDSSRQRGAGVSLIPGGTEVRPGTGQANLRRDN